MAADATASSLAEETREPALMEEMERTNIVITRNPERQIRLSRRDLYVMDMERERNCYACRGFGHLARNCRNCRNRKQNWKRKKTGIWTKENNQRRK